MDESNMNIPEGHDGMVSTSDGAEWRSPISKLQPVSRSEYNAFGNLTNQADQLSISHQYNNYYGKKEAKSSAGEHYEDMILIKANSKTFKYICSDSLWSLLILENHTKRCCHYCRADWNHPNVWQYMDKLGKGVIELQNLS